MTLTKRDQTILASIHGDEAAILLHELCKADEAIARRAIALQERNLAEIEVEEIAAGVCARLEDIEIEDVWHQAGPGPEGYSHPDDLAAEMMEHMLWFEGDMIRRYHGLRMLDQATTTFIGVLVGLQRFLDTDPPLLEHYPYACEGALHEIEEEWSAKARKRDRERVRRHAQRHLSQSHPFLCR